jgi:hypothetical protein
MQADNFQSSPALRGENHMTELHPDLARVLIPADAIQARVIELAQEIEQDYRTRTGFTWSGSSKAPLSSWPT